MTICQGAGVPSQPPPLPPPPLPVILSHFLCMSQRERRRRNLPIPSQTYFHVRAKRLLAATRSPAPTPLHSLALPCVLFSYSIPVWINRKHTDVWVEIKFTTMRTHCICVTFICFFRYYSQNANATNIYFTSLEGYFYHYTKCRQLNIHTCILKLNILLF